eukprot:7652055-Lingulodinium_polyedra.AAC.1
MVSSVIPGGLSHFAQKDGGQAVRLIKKPIFMPVEDCGPVNYAGKWFRQFQLKVREFDIDDILHQGWNASWNAAMDAGMGGTLHVTTVNQSI